MESLLTSVGLQTLINNFKLHKVSVNELKKANDEQLEKLGVSTIRDRIRLREALKELDKVNMATPSHSSSSSSHRDAVSLFRTSRQGLHSKQRKKRISTWTGSFFCFSEKDSAKCPNSTDRSYLQKSDLGYKKVQLLLTDNAEIVKDKIYKAYPKLVEGGGFELMRCLPSCRRLEILDCNWDTLSLRASVGGQANIYIRPIQRSIPIEDCGDFVTEDILERCRNCSELINVRLLRDHLSSCSAAQNLESTILQDVMPAISDTKNSFDERESEEQAEVVHYVLEYLEQSGPEQTEGTEHLGQVKEILDEDVNLSEVASGDLDLHVETGKDETTQKSASLQEAVSECTAFCKEQNISEPITILKKYQSLIVTGRPLEITEEYLETGVVGETNFILVDRSDLIQTAFDEIKGLTDLRRCLEVQFYGETAVGYGGPRKEFFSLILQQLQKEFFEPLRPWSEDYETIGKIMALSVVQNGKLPKMLTEEILKEVLENESPKPFIEDLRRGLDSLGLIQLVKELPTMIHLFTTSEPVPLTFKRITNLLKPQFSPEGSNRRKIESVVYSTFLKYMREAASGRRGAINLRSILQFATGTDEEPALGFGIEPSIIFTEAKSFMPTANTCINRMSLTIPQALQELPSSEELYKFFDFAFSNTYFGLE